MRKIPYDKLQAIAEIVIPKVVNKIIFDTDNGYVIYNKYFITKKDNMFTVLRRGDDKVFHFFTVKKCHSLVYFR